MSITGTIFAQNENPNEKKIKEDKTSAKINERYQESEMIQSINVNKGNLNYNPDVRLKFYEYKKEEKYSFDFVNSVGSNISFGGFWDKYAIINFTPNVFIRPADFISIYANNNLNCLVPLKGLDEHIKSITLQGFAVLAVDNSFKILFPSDHWVPQLISFAAKNVLINFVIKPSIRNGADAENPVLEFENYYYSLSINF